MQYLYANKYIYIYIRIQQVDIREGSAFHETRAEYEKSASARSMILYSMVYVTQLKTEQYYNRSRSILHRSAVDNVEAREGYKCRCYKKKKKRYKTIKCAYLFRVKIPFFIVYGSRRQIHLNRRMPTPRRR